MMDMSSFICHHVMFANATSALPQVCSEPSSMKSIVILNIFNKKGTLGIQCQSFALNSVPLKVRISQDTSDCRCVEFPLGNPSHWRSVKMGAGSFTSSWNQRYRKAR